MKRQALFLGAVIAAVFTTSVRAADLQATASSPTSITLTWTAPGDDGASGQASAYDIRYSLTVITDANWNSATHVNGVPTPKSAGSAETFDVTGLTPNTLYFIALKAGDEIPNWSVLSNVIQKSTLPENTPPAAITNLAAGAVTSSTIVLNWTAPGDDGTVGTATSYDIRYSTSAITTANWASATRVTGESSPKVAGGAETFTVIGLNPSTTYYFAIETGDEVPNWSTLSNVASKATSGEVTPPAAIVNLVAASSNATSVTLTWTAPGDDGSVGTASQYDVRYSTTAITAANFSSATRVVSVPAPKAAGGAETLAVNGLTAGTNYYFAVKTADEVPNWSNISNVVSKATTGDSTPPAQVTDLEAQ